MKEFEYAAPRTEQQVVDLLEPTWGRTEVLAGGTDLIGLMKSMVVTPARVVNLKQVDSLRGIHVDSTGVTIGTVTTLEALLDSPDLEPFPAVKTVVRNLGSLQLQCQKTVGGELCSRPKCWFFRAGHGLLAQSGRLVEQGDNRLHAVFGNDGPAKFVSASRLAPALISLDAQVRLVSKGRHGLTERFMALADLYRIPRNEAERELSLRPDEVLAHIHIPASASHHNASYEVRHGCGPDAPLASASASLVLDTGRVRSATIILGQSAPVPWRSHRAEQALIGRLIDDLSADDAGSAAVVDARPLSHNAYKIPLARTAVKRAVLLAAGLETGGF